MKITRFEDLECWQQAVDLAVEIYRESGAGELGRDFGIRDQLRRAAVSISSNIAEGKERETVAEFIRFLYIAKGSAGELCTQLIIAGRVGYIQQETFDKLYSQAKKIGGMIGSLIRTLKQKRA